MAGDTEDESLLRDRGRELADEVAFGAELAGTPRGDVRIPHGKAVVVLGAGDDVAYTGLLEQRRPFVGVELRGFEHGDEVLVAELVGRAVGLGVVLGERVVHVPRVP